MRAWTSIGVRRLPACLVLPSLTVPFEDVFHDLKDAIVEVIEPLNLRDIDEIDDSSEFFVDEEGALQGRIQQPADLLLD